MVAGVEVDPLILCQAGVAVGGQSKQAAKWGNSARVQAGQLAQLVWGGEAQSPDSKSLPHSFAVELAISRNDEHPELLIDFADQCFCPGRQRHTSNCCGLLAGEHWLMAEHLEADTVLFQQVLYAQKD